MRTIGGVPSAMHGRGEAIIVHLYRRATRRPARRGARRSAPAARHGGPTRTPQRRIENGPAASSDGAGSSARLPGVRAAEDGPAVGVRDVTTYYIFSAARRQRAAVRTSEATAADVTQCSSSSSFISKAFSTRGPA